ncbi:Protein of unknown function DUF2844 [Burkholderiaceae bacterium]
MNYLLSNFVFGRGVFSVYLKFLILSFLYLFSNVVFAAIGVDPIDRFYDSSKVITSVKTTNNYGNGYVLQEYTEISGSQIREYRNLLGQIFAVAWSGPVLPDLKKLISEKYLDDPILVGPQLSNRVISTKKGSLVIKSQGRMRFFKGYAYDLNILPSQFDLRLLE